MRRESACASLRSLADRRRRCRACIGPSRTNGAGLTRVIAGSIQQGCRGNIREASLQRERAIHRPVGPPEWRLIRRVAFSGEWVPDVALCRLETGTDLTRKDVRVRGRMHCSMTWIYDIYKPPPFHQKGFRCRRGLTSMYDFAFERTARDSQPRGRQLLCTSSWGMRPDTASVNWRWRPDRTTRPLGSIQHEN
jgi:hypothetical protein